MKNVLCCLYSRAKRFEELLRRIFTARWCGKTAVMPVAFQGFYVTHSGKKTSKKLQIISLASISVLLCLTLFLSACTAGSDDSGGALAPLPPPERDGGMFGVDVNINQATIDDWLERPDVTYVDVRMLYDPADFASIGGQPNLTRTLPGFRVVPLPFIATLDAMPVSNAYDGDKLFDVVWGEDGDILSVTPNYIESELILSEVFPKDKVVFLMCGGAGYSFLTRQFLNHMGWDESMIYSTGGNWYYEGSMGLDMTIDNDDGRIATWRVDYACIDFSNLQRIG